MGSPFSVRSVAWKNNVQLSVCDHDLLGKTLREGKLQMHISKDYFGGQLVGEEEALKLMKESSVVNLAGERAVAIAVSNRLASEKAVRIIQGVPFLMIYKF